MRVYFYREDNSGYRIVDLDPIEGGYINDVVPGTYRLLCFNTTETAYECNVGTFEGQELTTSATNALEPLGYNASATSVPQAVGTEDEEYHLSSDIVWGCSVIEVQVSEAGVTYHEVFDDSVDYSSRPTSTEHVITLYPHEMTSVYTVEIRNVKNLSGVSLMSATLSGLAENLNISTGDPDGESVVIPFALTAVDDHTIIGKFVDFGSTYADPNRLVLYVWTKDGKAYAYGTGSDDPLLNVTDQVVSAEDPQNVHIIIDGFTLPDVEAVGGSGFETEIDDWDTINFDISI
jgi:hypothetical protein